MRSTFLVAMVLFAAPALLVAQDADSPIVLKPAVVGSGLPVKMLVFVPGGAVPNVHYIDTAKAIQAEAKASAELWVVIPAVAQRLCVISCATPKLCGAFHKQVETGLAAAEAAGWTRNTDKADRYLAGHSLGGVCANSLIQMGLDEYAALMVFGSYVDQTGDFDLTHYPIPVLTMNGELDGGDARPGKTSVWWRQFVAMRSADADAVLDKPVIVLPGLNHSDYCPGFNVSFDLYAEVPQAEATATIGRTAGAFLSIQINRKAPKPEDVAVLTASLAWTGSLLTPYVTAEDMTVDRAAPLNADGVSQVCQSAQHMIAGLSDADDARLSTQDFFFEKKGKLETCHTNVTQQGDNVLVKTCSHTDYYADIDNTGEIAAASQLCCKMMSSEAVAKALGTTAAQGDVDCKTLNQAVIALAESLATNHTLSRFKAKGRGWCLLPDFHTPGNVGPLWLAEKMNLTETDTCMQVTAVTLTTAIDSPIYPGNTYCKMLSPERVLDWMMTDSLKALGTP